MIYHIYKLTNRFNGKVYVGQTTKTPAQRFAGHVRNSTYLRTRLSSAIKAYGRDAFIVETLARVQTRRDADRLEQEWICALAAHLPEFGYNLTLGGDGGQIPNAETRRRIGLAQRGKIPSAETRRRIGLALSGVKRPPSVGAKVSAAKLGHPVSAETRRKIGEANHTRPWTESSRRKCGKSQTNRWRKSGKVSVVV